MPTSLYEALWIFMVYAFAGWCTEVAYAGLNKGEFVNRGFLNGPYCPIYGFGVLIVVIVLTPLKGNLLFLFLGSVLLTTLLEYLTGLVLEKVFGNKWWDYSDLPFNIQGYVCLKFSILWGLGCMFIMTVIHPGIYKMIQWIPQKMGIGILVVFFIAFVIDAVVTINTILKFNRKIKMLEDVAGKMHRLSDEIGEDIFERVSDLMEKAEEMEEYLEEKRVDAQEYMDEKRADVQEARIRLESVRKEYRTLLADKQKGFRRLAKAFPNMTSKEHDKALQHYKEYLQKKNEKK